LYSSVRSCLPIWPGSRAGQAPVIRCKSSLFLRLSITLLTRSRNADGCSKLKQSVTVTWLYAGKKIAVFAVCCKDLLAIVLRSCCPCLLSLPVARKDHALCMCKFAQDCLLKMGELCCELETTLGPDTGDLNLRVGLHSGPVTVSVASR